MPAKRSSPELRRLPGENQEGELEGLGQADVLELNGRGPGGEQIVVVQRAAKPARFDAAQSRVLVGDVVVFERG